MNGLRAVRRLLALLGLLDQLHLHAVGGVGVDLLFGQRGGRGDLPILAGAHDLMAAIDLEGLVQRGAILDGVGRHDQVLLPVRRTSGRWQKYSG
ncbi:hypothetical protein D3C85_1721520 [compost metagenome]